MSKAIYEYIWLDGNQPNQTPRSKITILPKGRAFGMAIFSETIPIIHSLLF